MRRLAKGLKERAVWVAFAVATVALLLAALATFAGAGSASAATLTPAGADDDIPGVLLPIGATESQAVDSEDASDVYAVDLVEGQEVHIRCDPGTTNGPQGSFYMLVPGVQSLALAGGYDEITYSLRGGFPTRAWADFDYIPPKTGRYYLWIHRNAGTLAYTLSVVRTTRPVLALPPDADDVPGELIGPGGVAGVVSTLADPDDVYAVRMTAGTPVSIKLMPLTPYSNEDPARASLYLLDPSVPSLSERFGHVVEGRLLEAIDSRDTASRKTAEIDYLPTETGTYYVWVQAGGVLFGPDAGDFGYTLGVSGVDVVPGPPIFSDVQDSPYEEAIFSLAQRGIIRGFPDQTFRPSDPVSRQQFAKLIVKTLDLPMTGAEMNPFSDVASGLDPGDPLYPDKYVAKCAATGITLGRTPTMFDPYGDITRQQLITMVARAANLPDPPSDFMPNFSPGQFYPDEHYANARKAFYVGLLDGLQAIGPEYDFLAPSSRGECAQLLYNLALLGEVSDSTG
jgi:S-layer homology domain